jgi:hypothetical protein
MLTALAASSSNYKTMTVGCEQIDSTNGDGFSIYYSTLLFANVPFSDIQCKGESISKIDSFSIDPPLPTGIQARIEGNSLFITGKPAEVREYTTYNLTLSGSVKIEFGELGISTYELTGQGYVGLIPNSAVLFPKDVQDSILIGSIGEGKPIQVTFYPALPSGLSYDPISGYITGITNLDLGGYIHTLHAQITDEQGTRPPEYFPSVSNFLLIVRPSRMTYDRTTWYLPTNESVEIIPEVRSASTMSFSLYNGGILPNGLVLQPATGIISGVSPSTELNSNIQIKGTNALGDDYSFLLSLNFLAKDKMTCNFTGVASGCTRRAPYSCLAISQCFSSYNHCKESRTACQF